MIHGLLPKIFVEQQYNQIITKDIKEKINSKLFKFIIIKVKAYFNKITKNSKIY